MLRWLARNSPAKELDGGIVITLQPYEGERRLCRIGEAHTYVIHEGGATLLQGCRMRVPAGVILPAPDSPEMLELAYQTVADVWSPNIEVGISKTFTHCLLGPWQSRQTGDRYGINLESALVGVPRIIRGAKVLEQWPAHIDRIVTAWLSWSGWTQDVPRMRLWVASGQDEVARDVPRIIASITRPLVYIDGTVQDSLDAIHPDAVELACRMLDRAGLASAIYVADQAAGLVLPHHQTVYLWPQPEGLKHAAMKAEELGLKGLLGRRW